MSITMKSIEYGIFQGPLEVHSFGLACWDNKYLRIQALKDIDLSYFS